MMLITLEQAQQNLRIEPGGSGGNADDADLTLKIEAASCAIATYVKRTDSLYIPELDSSGQIVRDSSGYPVPALDSSGVATVRPDVQAACLLLVGTYYKQREAEQDGAIDPQYGYGYLPRPVVALLYPYRDPALQ